MELLVLVLVFLLKNVKLSKEIQKKKIVYFPSKLSYKMYFLWKIFQVDLMKTYKLTRYVAICNKELSLFNTFV